MATFTYFSKHAFERITQRTLLSPEQIEVYLNKNIYIVIGSEPASNREHRLFYSEIDQLHYIAIQDRHTGGVVTILTREYYENIFYNISELDLSAAVKCASETMGLLKKFGILVPKESHPNTFFISCIYKDLEDKRKCKFLTKIKANPFLNKIDILLSDIELDNKILASLSKFNIDPNLVYSITIRLGKHGELVNFEWVNSKIQTNS